MIGPPRRVNAPRPDGAGPNPSRWSLMAREADSVALDDYRDTAGRDPALPAPRAGVGGPGGLSCGGPRGGGARRPARASAWGRAPRPRRRPVHTPALSGETIR